MIHAKESRFQSAGKKKAFDFESEKTGLARAGGGGDDSLRHPCDFPSMTLVDGLVRGICFDSMAICYIST